MGTNGRMRKRISHKTEKSSAVGPMKYVLRFGNTGARQDWFSYITEARLELKSFMSQTGKHTQDLKEYERRTRRTSGHIQCKPQEPTSLHAKRSAEPAATDQYLRSSSLVQQSGLVNMNHATSRMMLALVAAGILVLFLVFAILDAPSIRPP